MGTRSLTIFVVEQTGAEIAVLYRQMDGYPSGHGKELADFLVDFVITKGIEVNRHKYSANGIECLAAQIVAYFKHEVGHFYLMRAGTRDVGEEYVYIVTEGEDGIPRIEVQEPDLDKDCKTIGYKRLFFGTPLEVLAWIDAGEPWSPAIQFSATW
jgi:hypothetical protein